MRRAIKSLILLVVGLCLVPLGWFLIAPNFEFGVPGPTASASVSGLAGILVFTLAFAIAGAGLSSAMTLPRFGNRGLKSNSLLSKEGQTPIAVYQQTMLQVKEENDAMEGKPKDEEHPPATRH